MPRHRPKSYSYKLSFVGGVRTPGILLAVRSSLCYQANCPDDQSNDFEPQQRTGKADVRVVSHDDQKGAHGYKDPQALHKPDQEELELRLLDLFKPTVLSSLQDSDKEKQGEPEGPSSNHASCDDLLVGRGVIRDGGDQGDRDVCDASSEVEEQFCVQQFGEDESDDLNSEGICSHPPEQPKVQFFSRFLSDNIAEPCGYCCDHENDGDFFSHQNRKIMFLSLVVWNQKSNLVHSKKNLQPLQTASYSVRPLAELEYWPRVKKNIELYQS